MRLNRRPSRISLAAAVWCSLVLGARAQEAESPPPVPSPNFQLFQPGTPEEIEGNVTALLDAFDLTPQPLPEIPDDPPPHEGAMIDPPEYRVEPPDLILIEVLESLPGRPVSGERLVRPDGRISLGFYGEVHVRGLTLTQVKVKVLKHMRRFLTDEVLGLTELYQGPPEPAKAPAAPAEPPAIPPAPEEDEPGPFDLDVDEPAEEAETPQEAMEAEKPHEILIQVDDGVSIRIEVKKGELKPEETPEEAPKGFEEDPFGPTAWRPVPPELSDRVFVDVTGYNSKNYYVQGDVTAPGKIPFTGNETVLDALQYAGGLTSTADPNNIKLVRPGRDGKPGKVYPVDLAGIRDRGETATNYQMFPGDRLVIGRDKIVEQTIQLDRLAAPLQTVMQTVLQESFVARGLQFGFAGREAEVLKTIVEFWIRELNRPGGAVFDEQILRDALIRGLPVEPIKPDGPRDEE